MNKSLGSLTSSVITRLLHSATQSVSSGGAGGVVQASWTSSSCLGQLRSCYRPLACAASYSFPLRSFCSGTSPSSSRRVGFIGVGAMGRPMCHNLIQSGAKVVVCDKNEEVLSDFQNLGAQVVRTPAELAKVEGLETVISMLPSADHVKEVFLGEDGIMSLNTDEIQSTLFIDCSSTGPECSLFLQNHLQEAKANGNKDFTFVDAPVSGGVPGAQAATLTFMVGTPSEETFERVQDVLVPTMGKQAVHCGSTGAGQSTKLCNNLVLGITMAGVCEALALGQKLGLDPGNLSKVFNSSSAQCWSTSLYNPCPGVMPGVPSSRDYENGFLTELMIKDLNSAKEAADGAKADLYLGEIANNLYQKMQSTHQRKDFSALYKYIYNGKGSNGV